MILASVTPSKNFTLAVILSRLIVILKNYMSRPLYAVASRGQTRQKPGKKPELIHINEFFEIVYNTYYSRFGVHSYHLK